MDGIGLTVEIKIRFLEIQVLQFKAASWLNGLKNLA